MPKKPPFYIGIDLGQAADYSTNTISKRYEVEGVSHYDVVHLDKWPLAYPYPKIVRDVVAMVQRPELADGWRLVIDRTGVGRPVYDQFKEAGLKPIGITITAGNEAHRDPDDMYCWLVPKLALVSNVKVLIQAGRLKFAKGLAHTDDLIQEALSFEMKFTKAANVTFEAWREGAHDDLLLGLAVALWFSEYGNTWANPSFRSLNMKPGDVPDHRPSVRKSGLPIPRSGFEVRQSAERRKIEDWSRSRRVRIRQMAADGQDHHRLAKQFGATTRQIKWVLEGDD